MGDDQSFDTLHIETERCGFCAWRCLGALLQATVNQQAGGRIEVQLVARTGDAAGTTVMGKDGIFHATHTRLGQNRSALLLHDAPCRHRRDFPEKRRKLPFNYHSVPPGERKP